MATLLRVKCVLTVFVRSANLRGIIYLYIVKFVSPCNTVVGVCALFIGGAGSTIINYVSVQNIF